MKFENQILFSGRTLARHVMNLNKVDQLVCCLVFFFFLNLIQAGKGEALSDWSLCKPVVNWIE